MLSKVLAKQRNLMPKRHRYVKAPAGGWKTNTLYRVHTSPSRFTPILEALLFTGVVENNQPGVDHVFWNPYTFIHWTFQSAHYLVPLEELPTPAFNLLIKERDLT